MDRVIACLLARGHVLLEDKPGLDAALTLVIGVATAGIFRRMLTPAGTRKFFGSGLRGLATGWLAGMLLPVCSLCWPHRC